MENKEQKKINHSACFIEKLPEIHIKGYSYCGPNTDLVSRLAQGEVGVNELDSACKEHDIAYAASRDLERRYQADKILVLKAFSRVYAKDSRIGERITALIVCGLIGIKVIFSKIELYMHRLRKCLTVKLRKKAVKKSCEEGIC